MSFYPGGSRGTRSGTYEYSLDDEAMTDSMARVMEAEMASLYRKVKEHALPDAGRLERRLLFVAIARGMLKYLHDQQEGSIEALSGTDASSHSHAVRMEINLNRQVS
ncbi:MAG: hypothetical protein JXB13_07020 [Phycisphaerae bacterium]|nr:hypothetical protein [Phycisphaerae bacterium]